MIYITLILFIFIFDVLILSARSHYTVDVVVATYYVPCLYYCLWRWLPDQHYPTDQDEQLSMNQDRDHQVFVRLSE